MKRTLLLSIVFLSFLSSVGGEERDGAAIMQSSYSRADGDDALLKMDMTLVDKNGGKRQRSLTVSYKDYGALRKSVVGFTAPADIDGTRFLSLENESGDDTQYLYLPAVGRARRIVSSQKNLSFVNTDFSYEDMQRRNPARDAHRFIGEEKMAGFDCFVVASAPLVSADSQYSKRVSWVDRQSLVIVRTEFFDKKNELCKVFTVKRLEQVNGIWTAMSSTMEDVKTGHTTTMQVMEAGYNLGLDDEVFSQRALEEK